jgi:catechol 2,3-dioxygenase-like lactoylglutathione lyase family enzyme
MLTTASLVAMRVARPTTDLDRIRSFYEHVVGLPLLWSFVDHDGFDGAIFGLPDARGPAGDRALAARRRSRTDQ